MIRATSLAALVAVLALPASGQDVPELVTDRPDQTESAVVVPRGSAQLEIGARLARDDQDGSRVETFEAPGALLRIGLHDRVELRLGWTGFVSQDVEVGTRSLDVDGLGDAEVGAKIHLLPERGARPEMAVLLGTSVPIGEDGLTSDAFDPNVRLSFAHTLSDRLSLGYNLGFSWETAIDDLGDESTLSSAFYTVALGLGLSDTVGAFVELFGDVAASAEGHPVHAMDGGLTFLLRPNLQLDLAAGLGLSSLADDWFVGVGLSVRVPR